MDEIFKASIYMKMPKFVAKTPKNCYTQLFKMAAGRLFRALVDLSCQSAFCLLRLIQKYLESKPPAEVLVFLLVAEDTFCVYTSFGAMNVKSKP